MPNVLIIGASGYIGLPLAQALLRTGNYTVWGLVRSQEKAKILTENEIHPIIGDAGDTSTWVPLLARVHIDLVIECSRAYEHGQLVLEAVASEGARRRDALAAEGSVGPKLAFLYVSGTWVHGSPDRQVSDLQVAGSRAISSAQPPEITAQRPAYEQAVLKRRDVLDVAVIRPAVVYGRGSWIFDGLWAPVLEAARRGETGTVRVPIASDTLINVVHLDDAVDGLVLVAARIGNLGGWPVFDLMAERLSGRDLVEGVGRVLGCKAKVDLVGPGADPFLAAMSLRHWEDSERARSILGWFPRRTSLLLGLDRVVNAWAASKSA